MTHRNQPERASISVGVTGRYVLDSGYERPLQAVRVSILWGSWPKVVLHGHHDYTPGPVAILRPPTEADNTGWWEQSEILWVHRVYYEQLGNKEREYIGRCGPHHKVTVIALKGYDEWAEEHGDT